MKLSLHVSPSGLALVLLIKASLFTAALGAILPSSFNCQDHVYPGPENPSFETGTLDGWEIVSGNAFGNSSVSDSTSYWGGPFGQVGKYFLWGFAQSGDAGVGQLRSRSFRASSIMSFLIGGGYDPDNIYVGLVRDSDGHILVKQTGQNDDALIRIIWDTSEWAAQMVHLVVLDNSTRAFGHINLDDVRIGCNALGGV